MASQLQTRKTTVDLAAPVARVSRIRRDPPLKVKEVTFAEIKERDARHIVIGIIAVALAVFVILIGFTNVAGWSPSQVTIHIEQS